jgi:uncharacterized membrane protein YbhN (UPF0104 family)
MSAPDLKGRRRAATRHWLGLSTGVALVFALVVLGGSGELDRLLKLEPLPVALALLVNLCLNALVAIRWGILLNAVAGRRVARYRDYFHYFVVARLLGLFLPKDVTDIGGRALYVQRLHRARLAEAGLSLLFDRGLDLLVAGASLAATLPHWLGLVDESTGLGLLGATLLAVALTLLLTHRAWSAIGLRWVEAVRRLVARWRRHPAPEPLPRDVLPGAVLALALLVSLAKFALSALRVWLVLWALGLHLPLEVTLLANPIGQASYALAVTPGGLGIFEAGWFGILVTVGLTAAAASALVVAQRLLITLGDAAALAVSVALRGKRQRHMPGE